MSDLLEKLPSSQQIRAERARRHLSSYIREAWDVVEPATDYLHNWHVDAIAEHLEAVSAGELTRLIINIPPRYMKSLQTSVFWPTWSWIERPHMRWMFYSYSQSLSDMHSLLRRHVIQSDWYQRHFGHVFSLASDQNVKREFYNDRKGMMIATSFGGTATGKGGDVLVVDDPLNPEDAHSDVERDKVNRIFDQTITSRLNDKKSGSIVVIMQRLHEEDLTGHLLEQGGWEHLCLPAEAEARTVITLPRSERKIVREPGDVLWPQREGLDELAKQKRAMGSYGYAGQYQQRPAPAEGGMLKRQWWGFWVPKGRGDLPPVRLQLADGRQHECAQMEIPSDEEGAISLEQQLQSWDCTFKDTKASDFVVGQVWGRSGADKFLLDQVRDRMDFPETVRAVERVSTRHPHATTKLVEDKANGPAVIATLKRKITGLIAIEPQGTKEARASAVSPQIEAANVFLPHPAIAPWVHDFIEECAAFPNGAHDDQVDGMSQALLRLEGRGQLRVRRLGVKPH